MTEEKPNPFTLIKHVADPNYATFEGVRVKREEKLFIREWGAFVSCTPYDNHFVFEVPQSRKRNGLSEYLCTCGSPAVVVNPENVRGRLFACHFEASNGYHQTSIINKKDFSNIAGETITLPEGGKKWLI